MRQQKDIDQCIKLIQDRLDDSLMDLPQNARVKEGYIKALEILNKRMNNYTGIGIESLCNAQSRAIAVRAVDYVNGDCSPSLLTDVPIFVPYKSKI